MRSNPGPALPSTAGEEACATVTRGTGRRGWGQERAEVHADLEVSLPPFGYHRQTSGQEVCRPVLNETIS